LKIKYIDGERFFRAVVAGAKRVFHRQDYLNKINVFPVADADTGTNMASTLRTIVDEVGNDISDAVSTTSKNVADSALSGAQGNSGIILAQFFYGVSETLQDKTEITTENFGNAVKNAIQHIYDALSHPMEGTIITVIREWSESIYEHRYSKTDFTELLEHGLEVARLSLRKTKDTLEAAKKAKVVDAGAQGFVDFIEGISSFISRGKIKELVSGNTSDIQNNEHTNLIYENPKFRYCTECLFKGKNLDLKSIREKIEHLGDSIILAGSDQKARLHIHTNSPDKIFKILFQKAEIIKQKIEDMLKQSKVANINHPKIALVTDSACDLPADYIDENLIHVVPVKVSFGNSVFLDKLTISPDYFIELLQSKNTHPRTSQPSPGDFTNLYRFLLDHYDSIISIQVTGASSGTYQNAVKAAQQFSGRKISVIDSQTVSGAIGLLAREAVSMIDQGLAHEYIVEQIEKIKTKTKLFVNIPSLKFMVKNGRISKAKGLLAKFLNLKPILFFDEIGRPRHCGKSFSDKGSLKKVFKLTEKLLKTKKYPKFIVSHVTAIEAAEYYVSQLRKTFNIKNDIPIVSASPVLGAHAGPGAAAIAILWSE